MNPKQAEILVHVACVAVIAMCVTLACTVLAPYPWAWRAMVGCAIFLYGKLGFAPADPVLARILQNLDPAKVASLSQRPPAPIINAQVGPISVPRTWDSIQVDPNDPKAVKEMWDEAKKNAIDFPVKPKSPITHPPADDETPVSGPDKGAA
ncbi:MAG TPA: hypothetical protein VGI70_19640 [Polyangiales bacterium]|jgi:hypothetical protein